MSEFKLTDQDFYLKQKVRKRTAVAAELLLSHETQVSMFDSFEYHVFLESHGTRHDIWQIVDLRLPQKRWKPFSATEEAAAILSGETQDPTLVAGRLFSLSGGERSEELLSEIINALLRARWPYEIGGDCIREGLISRDRWQAALDAFDAEHRSYHEESRRRVAVKPSAVINAAQLLGLHPEPTGEHPDKWRASCPGTNHPIFISAEQDKWFCGWCKRHGGPEELDAFARERRRKAS
jgi:hypothetical protein